VTRLWAGRQGLGYFLFATASGPFLGPTQPPIQRVPGALSPGVKRPGHESDQSPPFSFKVKNAWSYTSTPHTSPSWRGAWLSTGTTLLLSLPIILPGVLYGCDTWSLTPREEHTLRVLSKIFESGKDDTSEIRKP